MSHLRFGFCFDVRNPKDWYKPWPEVYAETLEFIQWSETIGFENVWGYTCPFHPREDGLPEESGGAISIAGTRSSIRNGLTR